MILGLKKLRVVIFAGFLICVQLSLTVSAELKVGVIIPELRAPFKVIFDDVGIGIDDALNKKTPKLILGKSYDPHSIGRWLEKENINAVITLGGVGQKSAVYVPHGIPVVLGALLSSPRATNKFPGVALTPNPKSLFKLLKQLDSQRKKVVVVYNPEKNGWLVELAKRQAATNGVQLIAYEATDIKLSLIHISEPTRQDTRSRMPSSA
mgnify:CR=1 FL=1